MAHKCGGLVVVSLCCSCWSLNFLSANVTARLHHAVTVMHCVATSTCGVAKVNNHFAATPFVGYRGLQKRVQQNKD